MFVEEVMALVELDVLSNALVGLPGVSGLSTEQRKRLTIAVEQGTLQSFSWTSQLRVLTLELQQLSCVQWEIQLILGVLWFAQFISPALIYLSLSMRFSALSSFCPTSTSKLCARMHVLIFINVISSQLVSFPASAFETGRAGYLCWWTWSPLSQTSRIFWGQFSFLICFNLGMTKF